MAARPRRHAKLRRSSRLSPGRAAACPTSPVRRALDGVDYERSGPSPGDRGSVWQSAASRRRVTGCARTNDRGADRAAPRSRYRRAHARINRNYGADHPLKVLRLDLTMERVRVDLNASGYLADENLENPGTSTPVDSSYARLFERYKRSDSPSVRYTAEYESARLTGEPNLPLWMNVLAERPTSPFRAMALNVITPYAVEEIRRHGREVTDKERDQLVAAALSPDAVDPRPLLQQRPAAENIRHVRQSTRFGLVDVGFGSGSRGQSGYSMLFERRGDRWVFVCLTGGWIS